MTEKLIGRTGMAGQGAAIAWIRDHVNYPHDDYCLIWPFANIRGYGNFGYLGESYYAHAYMCEIAHGAAPSPTHQSAHSCGRGHEGCTNPRHLSWKTPSENQQDKRGHGTVRAKVRRLTREDVDKIRSLAGKSTHDQLAAAFGVSRRNIGAVIDGRSWPMSPKINYWSAEDDAKLRRAISDGNNFTQISAIIGRPVGAVMSRAYRLGLKSGQPSLKPRDIRVAGQ